MRDLLEKLQYHPSLSPVLSVNTPIHLLPMLEVMGAEIHAHIANEKYSYVLLFMDEEIYFDQELEKYSSLISNDGMLVVCFPNKSEVNTYQSKLNEKFLWTALDALGFGALGSCDIDNKWKAITYKRVQV